jgi:DNA-binding NarL/FixJ family response regulator/anti-sigma regulatory factor (Ser/Thr protein kinase)
MNKKALELGKLGRILLVDDDAIIRGMLEVELGEKFEVLSAENAGQAVSFLDEYKIDLVLSDIHMPGMKGFDLIHLVKERFPGTKTALITAYNIDDYIRMAKENDISNIIPKSTPFNFDEFNSIVHNLVTEEIFGISRYMLNGFRIIGEYEVTSSEDISPVEKKILEDISAFTKPAPFVQILLEELITNAVYHAPMSLDGQEKYAKYSDVVLQPGETVKIAFATDAEKYGVSVMDTSGKLTKQQVLYRLDRHIHGEGLLDESGRGLHMSRIYSDRLVINIKRNHATEAIFFNYFEGNKYKGFKPLYINEI